jgi:hypothetical protein
MSHNIEQAGGGVAHLGPYNIAEAPIIAEVPDDSTPPGAAYTLTPTLTQGAPEPNWSLVAGPNGMTIDAGTGTVNWADPQPPGSVHTVTIRATNSAGSDDESWTLTVNALRHMLTLAASPSEGGSITADPNADPNDGKYAHGTVVTLTGNRAEGYAFDRWGGDANEPNNPVQVIMDADKNITGTFGYPGRQLTLNNLHPNWGRADVWPWHFDSWFVQDTNVRLTAIPVEGKAFTEWTLYDPNFPGDIEHAGIDSNNPIVIIMESDRSADYDFKCGSGVDQVVPLLTLALGMGGLVVWVSRRRR